MVDLPQLDNLLKGYNFSGIFNQFYAVGKILLSFAILGLIIWYVLKKLHVLKPSIKVFIKDRVGGRFDVGRKVKVKGGITKCFLTKERVNIEWPHTDFLTPFKKFLGMGELYMIRKVGEGQYLPYQFGNPSETIDVMGESTKSWMINELEEAHAAYLKVTGWLEKYQTIIGISVLAACFMIMIIFSLGYMEQVISAFNGLVNKMAAIQIVD